MSRLGQCVKLAEEQYQIDIVALFCKGVVIVPGDLTEIMAGDILIYQA